MQIGKQFLKTILKTIFQNFSQFFEVIDSLDEAKNSK